jgi:hypothetical protein
VLGPGRTGWASAASLARRAADGVAPLAEVVAVALVPSGFAAVIFCSSGGDEVTARGQLPVVHAKDGTASSFVSLFSYQFQELFLE